MLNIELLKHLRKDFPQSKDWVTFNGEGEYNHDEFIDWVDQLKEENMMPDILITSKLALVFSGVAREWYIEKRRDTGSMSWDQWKQAIEERFGTDTWKNQLEEAFLNDNFNPAYHKDCLIWAIKQKKRIRAFSPDSSSKRIVEKILFRMNGDIRNSVRSLIQGDITWDKFIAAFQDVCKNNNNNRNRNNINNRRLNTRNFNREPSGDKDMTKDPVGFSSTKAQPSSTERKLRACRTCGSTDPTHVWKDCKGKGRAINEVDFTQEERDNRSVMEFMEYEDSSSSQGGSPSEHHQIDTIEVEHCMEQNIAELQAEAGVPQMWDKKHTVQNVVDARLLLTRPAAGRAHIIGRHCLTMVMIHEKEVYLLLDSGASCPVVGVRYLTEIFPNWRDHALPCSNTTFPGCGSSLYPIGIVQLPVIFPHTQGSVRIQAEFVVMENANPKYFILGDEFLSLYGVDIVHSKEKFFTIGNENKKKKFALQDHRPILPIYQDMM